MGSFTKKIFIKTFGCQMNARDSEFVTGILLDSGFKKADSVEKADIILFNSCSVRKHAEDRLFGNILNLNKLKKKRPGLIIGLMGCTAQNYAEGALKRAPIIDFVCGPGDKADIAKIIDRVLKNRYSVIATGKVNEKLPEIFPEYRDSLFKACISIGEGCNNFCSYCIVPYVRGRERSREARHIIREAKDLANRGFKEVTLLGQNVNSYGEGQGTWGKGQGFVKLLKELDKIKGIERIRFMTSHPKDASIELFKAMRDCEKVCEHLHLPLQSGSSKILRLMNRGYPRDKYLKLVREYKKIVPDGSITTDIIVGFPGETEKDFKDTCAIMKEAKFDSAYIFKYSPRPPAKSAALKDDVPQDVKQERLAVLLGLQSGISQERNDPLKGNILDILVDGCDRRDKTIINGRTRTNKVTVFKGNDKLVGKMVNVKIEVATPYALKGKIIK